LHIVAFNDVSLQAIDQGFTGIDTANQAKHYNEAGVGVALAHAFGTLGYKRENFWIQTKRVPFLNVSSC
jgi:diketogulonate reductase-like aldo/keto reductase